MMEEVRQVLWGEVMVSFVVEDEQFRVDTEFDWKPVWCFREVMKA